jgi:ABC-type sugar transport system substrate-binding protein
VVSAARGRTLVFARDVAAANGAADALAAAGLPVVAYHRGVPPAEREAALATLAR